MHKLVTVRQKKSIIIVISFLASYGYVYRETQLSNAVQISEKTISVSCFLFQTQNISITRWIWDSLVKSVLFKKWREVAPVLFKHLLPSA